VREAGGTHAKPVRATLDSEPLLLFQNTPSGLRNISPDSGPVFTRRLNARGLALDDFDNDGAVDVLIAVNDGPPVLLRNNAGRQNHWLGLSQVGKKSNPDAIGAHITYQAGDLKQTRSKVGGGSYLSSHDPRIVLGLAKHEKLDSLEITWPQPSGRVQRFTDLPINRYITITENEPHWR
jgi:enediyne biosynthesis protein E4